jgi:hypothetical protein
MSTLDREYLINLITKIMNVDGSEEELDMYINELKKLSPLPNITDLIFYPEVDDVSAEEIANIIINFQPKHFLE